MTKELLKYIDDDLGFTSIVILIVLFLKTIYTRIVFYFTTTIRSFNISNYDTILLYGFYVYTFPIMLYCGRLGSYVSDVLMSYLITKQTKIRHRRWDFQVRYSPSTRVVSNTLLIIEYLS